MTTHCLSGHTADDVYYMELALSEARKGLGRTSPNPPVGAVLVKNNRVIGRGYHARAGTAHAEVNAILDATGEVVAGSTLYVTLEPCNHTGKTPPCTQAILAAKISRVVIGAMDPNNRVVGGGYEFLKKHGVAVESGVMAAACQDMIRFFVKHNQTGLPWVALKAGMSLDGKLSYQRGQGGSITGAASLGYSHHLRNIYDAILIGRGTALIDNPSLTTRLPDGTGRDPLRIVLDSHLRLDPDSTLLQQNSSAGTWIYCAHTAPQENQRILEERGAQVHRLPHDVSALGISLHAMLHHLGSQNICSVLVEGGAGIHGSFLRKDLADQAYLFVAPCVIGEQGTPFACGWTAHTKETARRLAELRVTPLGGDVLIEGLFIRPS